MRRLAARTLGAIALTSSGCGQITGIDDYRATDQSDGSSGAANLECRTCLSRECAVELAACEGDSTCTAGIGCELDCAKGDVACASRCAGRFLNWMRGREPYDLLSCRAQRCTEDCGVPCGGFCTGNQGCDECLANQCDGAAGNMVRSSGIAPRLACEVSTWSLTNPVENLGDCASFDTGPAFSAWNSCRLSACVPACSPQSPAPDWQCVGKIERHSPNPSRRFVDFEVRVTVGSTRQDPGVGFTVAPCNLLGNAECDPPETTDYDGIATLRAELRATGTYFSYLMISDPARSIDPTIHVVAPPLIHDGDRIVVLTYTSQEMDAIAAQAGVEFLRKQHGLLGMLAMSCGLASGSGLYFESNNLGGRSYYLTEALVASLEATQTTRWGFGGFIEIPPGVGTFTVKRRQTDEVVATFTAPIVLGHFTNVLVPPSPEGGW
jgi:hypothetical protein